MKTTKTLLNNLTLEICNLTGHVNSKQAAIEQGKPQYLSLVQSGIGAWYSLYLIDTKTGSCDAFCTNSPNKAPIMEGILKGIICGLRHNINN